MKIKLSTVERAGLWLAVTSRAAGLAQRRNLRRTLMLAGAVLIAAASHIPEADAKTDA